MDFRREWLTTLVAECQVFIGNVIALGDVDELEAAASAWVRALPDPKCHAEDVSLRAMLIDVALRWSSSVHERSHRGTRRRRCGFVATHGLDRFAVDAGRTAKQSFEDWARLFAREFARTHKRSPAQRAAHLIRTKTHARWDLKHLAGAVGVTPAHLSRTFRHERGLALPEYLRRMRLLRALEAMVELRGKIEPLSMEVGYRSKKNFYRVFKQLTGLTPTGFRRLPPASARQMVESTRLKLLAFNRS